LLLDVLLLLPLPHAMSSAAAASRHSPKYFIALSSLRRIVLALPSPRNSRIGSPRFIRAIYPQHLSNELDPRSTGAT
jgi:hypothetical protein